MAERLDLQDSTISMVGKMSEGNPGAVSVLVQMIKEGPTIDPQSWAGGISSILALDSWGIYGSRIWMLYKDVCKEDLTTMLAVLRACQLGLITISDMQHAIDNYGEPLDLSKIKKDVKKQLKDFAIKPTPEVW